MLPQLGCGPADGGGRIRERDRTPHDPERPSGGQRRLGEGAERRRLRVVGQLGDRLYAPPVAVGGVEDVGPLVERAGREQWVEDRDQLATVLEARGRAREAR